MELETAPQVLSVGGYAGAVAGSNQVLPPISERSLTGRLFFQQWSGTDDPARYRPRVSPRGVRLCVDGNHGKWRHTGRRPVEGGSDRSQSNWRGPTVVVYPTNVSEEAMPTANSWFVGVNCHPGGVFRTNSPSHDHVSLGTRSWNRVSDLFAVGDFNRSRAVDCKPSRGLVVGVSIALGRFDSDDNVTRELESPL